MAIRVGFIGLGNQGKPIAAHLAPAGFETTVYDLADEPVQELVAGGARAAKSPREVGERADVIGICVPADEHVRAVVYGEDGLLAGVKPGAVIAIHSTILPEHGDRDRRGGPTARRGRARRVRHRRRGARASRSRSPTSSAATPMRSRRCARCSRATR